MGIFRITMNQMVSHIERIVDGYSVRRTPETTTARFIEHPVGARPRTGR
jgi:hypothetical protein